MPTITSANSVLTLQCAIFPAPVRIEGFATDDGWLPEEAESGETQMGIDGQLSAGYTPYKVPFELTQQANSPSMYFFEELMNAERAAMDKYEISGNLLIPALKMEYALVTGWLQKVTALPAGKKVLEHRKFTIDWESIVGSPTA